jgi:hypothetical protein
MLSNNVKKIQGRKKKERKKERKEKKEPNVNQNNKLFTTVNSEDVEKNTPTDTEEALTQML